jgi:hypothetical protein
MVKLLELLNLDAGSFLRVDGKSIKAMEARSWGPE